MIILASSSPRRKQLLSQLVDSFYIYKVDIDEEKSYILPYQEAVKDISIRKGLKAKEIYPNDIIISADTIVVVNNQIIGKPKDKKDAYEILKMLSGKTHEVITSYTIIFKDKLINKSVVSFVTFNSLNDELINRYIESGSPMDKAGAYGIQDNEQFPIISHYEGSLNNIIGFPIEEIKIDLESITK
mgnify:CR=1 FL=1